MKILNLTDKKNSEIKYEISRFPDGQQNIRILTYNEAVTIKARLNNFSDLELIIAATKSLRGLDIVYIGLYVPYFLGSRSDRKFEVGGNNYLKDVICPVINSMNFAFVATVDPHSDVLEACLNNFKSINNHKLISKALKDWFGSVNSDNYRLLSPDAGALKKIYSAAERINYEKTVYVCSKHRDEKGKLSKVQVPDLSNVDNPDHDKDLVIIDDICDGGRTFINIAKALRDTGFDKDIYLIVTHGIFSNGLNELTAVFKGIYCTNSYKDIEEGFITSYGNPVKHNVKQLDVFDDEF